MGRDDYRYDDDRRPRRRPRRDDDDYREPYYPPRQPRSGAVTAVGVLNLVIGPLVLVFSMCLFVTMLPILNALSDKLLGVPGLGGDNDSPTITLMIMSGVFVAGALAIVTGIGLLCRAGWSRILGLLMGAGALSMGLLYLTIAVLFLVVTTDSDSDALVKNVLQAIAQSVFFLGYGFWTYLVLLNPRRLEEFR